MGCFVFCCICLISKLSWKPLFLAFSIRMRSGPVGFKDASCRKKTASFLTIFMNYRKRLKKRPIFLQNALPAFGRVRVVNRVSG